MAEEARSAALDRFRLLVPHLEQGLPLRGVAAESGIAFRTAQRWVARYRKQGLAGLARLTRQDKGRSRVISAELRRTIEGLGLERPALPASSSHRQIKQMAELLGEPAPSYWMVCAVLRGLAPSLLALAHEGPKAYGDRFDLVHRREASGPNAVWQADHAQLNILLLREDGTSAKPWLTVVLDDWSRGGRLLSCLRSSVDLAHRARAAAGDLAQGGARLAGRRHSGGSLYRQRRGFFL